MLLSKFENFFHGEILGQHKYLRDLSKGNQKKAGIVASFIGDPEVVILDEPFRQSRSDYPDSFKRDY